jgi:NitT/TauT family transport system substrate-binding protein
LTFALTLSGATLHAQETKKPDRVRIGVITSSITLPFIAAKRQGYFQRYGVDVELVLIRPPLQTPALLNGDLDFSTITTRDIGAALNGLPIRLVMVLVTRPQHVLVVRPEIRSVKDLRNKTLGISGPKQLEDVLLRRFLVREGLTPDIDLRLLPMAGAGSDVRMTAMMTGRIDGTMLAGTHPLVAAKRGYNILFSARDVSNMVSTTLAATTQKIQKQPHVIIGTIKGTLQGFEYLKQNKAEFMALFAQDSGVKDPESLEEAYVHFFRDRTPDGIVPDEFIYETVDFVKQTQGVTRTVDLKEIADWSLARRAAQELKSPR